MGGRAAGAAAATGAGATAAAGGAAAAPPQQTTDNHRRAVQSNADARRLPRTPRPDRARPGVEASRDARVSRLLILLRIRLHSCADVLEADDCVEARGGVRFRPHRRHETLRVGPRTRAETQGPRVRRNARSNANGSDVFFQLPNVDAAGAADDCADEASRGFAPPGGGADEREDAVPARQAVRAEDTRGGDGTARIDARQEERRGDAAQAPAKLASVSDDIEGTDGSGSDLLTFLEVSIEIRVRSKLRRQPPRARRGALR